MITQLYTAINTALSAVNFTKYYTVVPDGATFPHIYIVVITQTFAQHKSTSNIDTDTIQTIDVQIEGRSKTALQADQIRTQVMQALYTAFDCKISPSKGLIYDSETGIYRGLLEVEIMQ